jgi:3-oxoacyl-[acyl-carrier protein] reductase
MKYAIVTGGTRGIGKQICIDLLKNGFFVITNYASDQIAAEIARTEFLEYSENFSVVRFDQSSDKEIENFTNFIKTKTNKLHCIVCNTGITNRGNLNSITNHDWEKVFKVNVHSHFYLIRDLDTLLQEKSRIIFIGSLLGTLPHSCSITYGVTKAAIHALSKYLVKQFADRQITVNTISPGFVETDWQKNKPKEQRINIYNKTALNRFATVNEISNVLMMLIENDFINGTIISVDGGYDYK